MSPQELTALNLDKTALLEDVLQTHFSGDADGLLGELQFSFLAFLMGQSLEGECDPGLVLLQILSSDTRVIVFCQSCDVPVLLHA